MPLNILNYTILRKNKQPIVLEPGGKISRVSMFQKVYTGYRTDDLYDEPFNSIFLEAMSHDPFAVDNALRYRIYQTCKFAELSLRAEGDFLFCGVAHGVAPRAVSAYLGDSCRRMILIDPYDSDTLKYQADPPDIANSEIVKRSIPDGLSGIGKLAFILLNTGSPEDEIASMPALLSALQPGGVMLITSYGGNRAGAEGYQPAIDSLLSINLLNGTCAAFRV